MKDTYSNYVTSSSGAFKIVDIYQNYVVKRAKNTEENGYHLSYSDARNQSQFFNEDGEFQEEWVDEYNYDHNYCSGGDEHECYEELAKEFAFMNQFKHIPIFVPILWGDETEYAMARAKTFDDFDALKISDAEWKRKHKAVMIKLAAKFNRIGIKVSKSTVERYRLSSMVELGLRAKLSLDRIAEDLFWFVQFDATRELLGDMHNHNIGIYRGHIVTFDVGQAYSNHNMTIREYMASNLGYRLRGWGR